MLCAVFEGVKLELVLGQQLEEAHSELPVRGRRNASSRVLLIYIWKLTMPMYGRWQIHLRCQICT